MVNRTILGYAVLDYLSETHRDVLDMYVPLACICITQEDCVTIDRVKLRDLLQKYYGFERVSIGAADSIMARMKHDGLIERKDGVFYVNKGEVIKHRESHPNANLDIEFDRLVNAIVTYAKRVWNQTFNAEDITKGILAFFEKHDEELIQEDGKLYDTISKKKTSQTVNYIISQYVLSVKDAQSDEYKMFLKLAKGHILSSAISLDNFADYEGNMDGVIVALDAPILFDILELNGSSNYELVKELFVMLKERHAKLIVFPKNLDEVRTNISDAIEKLRTKNYDISRTTRLIRSADRNNLSAEDLALKLGMLDAVMKKYEIVEGDIPDIPDNYREIDTKRLTEIIVGLYTNNGAKRLYSNIEDMIEVDVNSISYVYRLRGGRPLNTLSKCKAILLTTNTAIAYASRLSDVSIVRHRIPACMTDVFLSTLMWMNFPSKNKNLNEKLLMSTCYSNTNIDDLILTQYYDKIDAMQKDGTITPAIAIEAKTSELAMNLLQRKTLNDPDIYTDTTPEEVVQEMKLSLEREKNEAVGQVNTYDKNLHRFSSFVGWLIYVVLFLVLCGAFAHRYFKNPSDPQWLVYVYGAIGLFTCLWGPLNHAKLIWTKADIVSGVEKWVFKKLKKYLSRN